MIEDPTAAPTAAWWGLGPERLAVRFDCAPPTNGEPLAPNGQWMLFGDVGTEVSGCAWITSREPGASVALFHDAIGSRDESLARPPTAPSRPLDPETDRLIEAMPCPAFRSPSVLEAPRGCVLYGTDAELATIPQPSFEDGAAFALRPFTPRPLAETAPPEPRLVGEHAEAPGLEVVLSVTARDGVGRNDAASCVERECEFGVWARTRDERRQEGPWMALFAFRSDSTHVSSLVLVGAAAYVVIRSRPLQLAVARLDLTSGEVTARLGFGVDPREYDRAYGASLDEFDCATSLEAMRLVLVRDGDRLVPATEVESGALLLGTRGHPRGIAITRRAARDAPRSEALFDLTGTPGTLGARLTPVGREFQWVGEGRASTIR